MLKAIVSTLEAFGRKLYLNPQGERQGTVAFFLKVSQYQSGLCK